ncbi:MAG TPA: PEP-CTERM sorting domain-containing protein [Rhizomicrobium sp.]|nr:PEP-CTERM sorting domain-containing protein [Rhizomicrobium sp.]
MNWLNKAALSAAILLALMAAPAQAAFINAPVPTNAYITFGSFDWAWANPCAPSGGCGNIDLSYQSTQGWRLPTLDEVLAGPSASDFVFRGANVPYLGTDPISGAYNGYLDTGSDFACATPYFSNIYHHCDFGDQALDGLYPTGNGAEETWVIRAAAVNVPEPFTLSLFGTGIAGAAALRRRKQRV